MPQADAARRDPAYPDARLKAARRAPRQGAARQRNGARVHQDPGGPWLLVLIAVGLVTFGIYSLAEAQWRRG